VLAAGPNRSEYRYGNIQLIGADNSFLVDQTLPADNSISTGLHTLNQAVDLQVGARQRVRGWLEVVSGNAANAVCTATGMLDTLQ
jgi:hypothetical protein